MNNEFNVSLVGLGDKLQRSGWTIADLNRLASFENLTGVKHVVHGVADIVDPAIKLREENGIVYFSVLSRGLTAVEMVKELSNNNSRGVRVDKLVDNYPPAGTVYELALVSGDFFPPETLVEDMYLFAKKNNFKPVNRETAFLVWEAATWDNDCFKFVGNWYRLFFMDSLSDGEKLVVERHLRGFEHTYLQIQNETLKSKNFVKNPYVKFIDNSDHAYVFEVERYKI